MRIWHCQHQLIIVECNTDDDCTGSSDTCVAKVCYCGANEKCSGRTDTCDTGFCKCGGIDGCNETQVCALGICQGISLFIFKESQIDKVFSNSDIMQMIYTFAC